jgi:hypothetical protein
VPADIVKGAVFVSGLFDLAYPAGQHFAGVNKMFGNVTVGLGVG